MSNQPRLYSLENLNEIYHSDYDFVDQIVQIFVENIPKYISDLSEACKKNDWTSVSFTAHKLKSNIKLFNISSALNDIIEIELNAKAMTNLETLPEKIENVSGILSAVGTEMKGKI